MELKANETTNAIVIFQFAKMSDREGDIVGRIEVKQGYGGSVPIEFKPSLGELLQPPNKAMSVKEFDELLAELKDKLDKPAIGLSLEAQQKLCIARLLPVKPAVLLMDEPCSALDPKGTEAVEELIWSLRGEYTILIVTHNMAQARRATEECIFMLMGKVVEHSATDKMFLTPEHQETADYIEGRYG